jgi:hypothetical protein
VLAPASSTLAATEGRAGWWQLAGTRQLAGVKRQLVCRSSRFGPARRGYYIPQNTYGLYFGASHHFRLQMQPVMYMGYPRFAYGSYPFMILDPRPHERA